MGEFFHALRVFGDQLTDVGWLAVAVALALQLAKLVVRSIAWRNILQASYPETPVPRRPVLGAYLAGVGVNSIVPGRAGDLVKIYLVHRRVEGTTYTTLASTLVTETLLDFVLAGAILVWALTQGVLPSLDVLPSLHSFDWTWLIARTQTGAHRVRAADDRGDHRHLVGVPARRPLQAEVGRGFWILRDWRRYAREVASWQLLSWVFRIASLYFFLKAFHVHASIHNALLAQVVDSLSTLLPFSPGGVGTKQGLLVYVLNGEASSSRLLAFSVGQYVGVTVFNVVVGAIAVYAMLRTLRLREILGRAKAAESESRGA